MARADRISRAQVLALPRPAPAVAAEWIVVAVAVGLLLAGLFGL